jgi:hypothetical protein
MCKENLKRRIAESLSKKLDRKLTSREIEKISKTTCELINICEEYAVNNLYRDIDWRVDVSELFN